MHNLTVPFLRLCRSTINSSTIAPKTHPNVSAFDNQKVKAETTIRSRVPDAASESIQKVSRPPPRIPNGTWDFLSTYISTLISSQHVK